MIIQLAPNTPNKEREALTQLLKDAQYQSQEVRTQQGLYWVALGKEEIDIRRIGQAAGVLDVHHVEAPQPLVSREWKVGRSLIDLGDGLQIGGSELALMAGPCSIESEAQIEATVAHLKANEVRIMRGGVFKPRSSPYSFQGLGEKGLELFSQHCQAAGIRIITEVMEAEQIDLLYDSVDIFQVGARNAQNYNLLKALGQVDKPVLLKRGISGSIAELLHAAEYVFSAGNEQILLCERGIRSFEQAYRNTLDLNAIPILKEKSHLPVIVDPSHGIGIRRHVEDMALAAVMAGADGLLVEVHPKPEQAFSDGQQSLHFQEATRMYRRVRAAFALRQAF